VQIRIGTAPPNGVPKLRAYSGSELGAFIGTSTRHQLREPRRFEEINEPSHFPSVGCPNECVNKRGLTVRRRDFSVALGSVALAALASKLYAATSAPAAALSSG
jgi:hypothetical protein